MRTHATLMHVRAVCLTGCPLSAAVPSPGSPAHLAFRYTASPAMASQGSEEPVDAREAEGEEEEEEEASNAEEEEPEDADEGEPEAGPAAAAASGASGSLAAGAGAGSGTLVAAAVAPVVAASPSKRTLLRALGSALHEEGYCDELAAQIRQYRKEREEAAKEKKRRDAAVRNEERKRARLLQKLDRVPTNDLVLVINHRAANCEKRELRENAAAAPKAKADAKAKAAAPKAKGKAKAKSEPKAPTSPSA